MTHEALLAAIAAAPDDDAPRAVYADALLAAGDPAGEFILVQLAIAKRELEGATDEDLAGLRARESELGVAVSARAPLAEAVFRRGFAVEAHARPDGFAELAGDPLHALDLRRLVVMPGSIAAEPALERLSPVALPHLATVAFNAPLDDAERVRAWSMLPRLTGLHFNACQVNAEAVISLATAAGPLRELSTFGISLTNAMQPLLSACPDVSGLELSFAELSVDDLVFLMVCRPRLQRLGLRGTFLHRTGAHMIAQASFAPDLEALDVASCTLTDRGAQILVDSPLPQPLRLTCRANDLDASTIATLRARFAEVTV